VGFPDDVTDEVESALRLLTSQIIQSNPYGLRQSVAKTQNLQKRFEAINTSDLPIVSKIYWLVEDCKRHGTLPFAGVARCAFIATDLLKSLVSTGFLNQDGFDSFFSGDQAKAGEEDLNHKKESKSTTDSTGVICSAAKKVKNGSNDNGNPCEGRCWRRCFNHYKPNQLHFKIDKITAFNYSFSGKQK
jgi:hypothetical protein